MRRGHLPRRSWIRILSRLGRLTLLIICGGRWVGRRGWSCWGRWRCLGISLKVHIRLWVLRWEETLQSGYLLVSSMGWRNSTRMSLQKARRNSLLRPDLKANNTRLLVNSPSQSNSNSSRLSLEWIIISQIATPVYSQYYPGTSATSSTANSAAKFFWTSLPPRNWSPQNNRISGAQKNGRSSKTNRISFWNRGPSRSQSSPNHKTRV